MPATEYVSVIPEGVRQLANALQELSSALASGGPTIQQGMTDWEGELGPGNGLDYSAVSKASISQRQEDASGMSRRADLAAEVARDSTPRGLLNMPARTWHNQLIGIQYSSLAGGVSIPFDAAAFAASGDEGGQESFDLWMALQNPTAPGSRDVILQVGQSLADHQGDKSYLDAFYAQKPGGADSFYQINAALQAYQQDNQQPTSSPAPPSPVPSGQISVPAAPSTPSGPTDQQILGFYGVALAGATRDGYVKSLPPDLFKEGQDGAPDPRLQGIAALLQNGPSGDQWNPAYLAAAGSAAMSATNSRMASNGGPMDGQSLPALQWSQALGALDPALLARIGENQNASHLFLTDPSAGAANAMTMFNYRQWLGNGPGGAPQIIINATTGPWPHDQQSVAFTNIVNSLGSQAVTMPSAYSLALSQMASAFVPDLSRAAYFNADKDTTTGYDTDNKMQTLSLDGYNALFGDIGGNPDALSRLNTVIGASTYDVVKGGGTHVAQSVTDLSALQARILVAQENSAIDTAAAKDQVNAYLQAYSGALLGAASNVPFPAEIAGEVPFQQASGGAGSLMALLFPTNAASNAQTQAQVHLSGAWSVLDVPIVQGLLDRNPPALTPPDPARYSWYQDGYINIDPNDQAQLQSFKDWMDGVATNDPNTEELNPFGNLIKDSQSGMVKAGMKWSTH